MTERYITSLALLACFVGTAPLGCGETPDAGLELPTPPVAAIDGKSDSRCRTSAIDVAIIPTQWPPSRLGEPIAAHLPEGAAVLKESVGDYTRYVTHDRNADGEADLWVQFRDRADQEIVSSIRFTEDDGSYVLLWSDDSGRVYWEQRWDDDGWFANSFDQDRNGYIDDLRTGEDSCLTSWYRLDEESALNQIARAKTASLPDGVTADMLRHPHVMLSSGEAMYVRPDAHLERGDVVFRFLWDELLPALPQGDPDRWEVGISDKWVSADTPVDVRNDAAGVSIRVQDTNLDGWDQTPLVTLKRGDLAPIIVGVVSPEIVYDDTANQRVHLQDTIEHYGILIERHQETLDRAQGFVDDPSTIATRYEADIAELEAELAEADQRIDAERPQAISDWNAATAEEQHHGLSLLNGDLSQAEADALTSVRDDYAGAHIPADALPELVRDIAFAGLYMARDQADHPFFVAVSERRSLAYDLAQNRAHDADERRERLAYYQERRDYAAEGLAEAQAGKRDSERQLARLEQVPSLQYFTTRHEPYTY